MIHLCRWYKIV